MKIKYPGQKWTKIKKLNNVFIGILLFGLIIEAFSAINIGKGEPLINLHYTSVISEHKKTIIDPITKAPKSIYVLEKEWQDDFNFTDFKTWSVIEWVLAAVLLLLLFENIALLKAKGVNIADSVDDMKKASKKGDK